MRNDHNYLLGDAASHCRGAEFNKTSSGYQLRHGFQRRAKRRLENQLCCRHDENRDGSPNVGSLSVRPPGAAASPRKFY
jgi:hypothetical protein